MVKENSSSSESASEGGEIRHQHVVRADCLSL